MPDFINPEIHQLTTKECLQSISGERIGKYLFVHVSVEPTDRLEKEIRAKCRAANRRFRKPVTWFAISHLPTGYGVLGGFMNLEDARTAAQILANLNWDFKSAQSDVYKKERLVLARAVYDTYLQFEYKCTTPVWFDRAHKLWGKS